MAHRVRLVRRADLPALLDLAALTGGGMTNLPHDEAALRDKIERSERSCAADVSAPDDEFYLFVLEEEPGGAVVGTSSIYSRIGARWPFYSYKVNRISHLSQALGRHYTTSILTLVNDFDGASAVGGLFLHPRARSGGLGRMLARARYLFIARHRERFGSVVVADLRGWHDGAVSPFWEAIGRKFFDKAFLDADLHNAVHGNQFIADLMPRFPIYTALLPVEAQQVIGRPHDDAVPAKAMLEAEGFVHDGYVDIFDAGPTLHARTDHLHSVAACAFDGDSLVLPLSDGTRLEATGAAGRFVVTHRAA